MEQRERELRQFLLLDHEQQRQAMQRLAASGLSDYGIAAATGLSVDMVRAVIGERKQVAA